MGKRSRRRDGRDESDEYPRWVRWLVVWQVCICGWPYGEVRNGLRGWDAKKPAASTLSRIVHRYWRTGGVDTWQGQRVAPPPNRRMNDAEELQLVRQLVDWPHATLGEHRKELQLATGVRVSLSTICRAVWRMGYRRTKARARPRAHPLRARATCALHHARSRSCRTSRATSTCAARAPSGTRS